MESDKKNPPKSFMSQGTYGCVMYPRVKCSGKLANAQTTKKKELSKIVQKNKISENEINIGLKIKEIMKSKKGNMQNSLIGVYRHCDVKRENIMKYKQCNILKSSKKSNLKTAYQILYSQYIPSDNLRTYLYKNFTRNKFLKLYLFMIESIRLMLRNNIVHHDLTTYNMIVSKETNKQFHVIDFGLSFQISDCFKMEHGTEVLNMSYLKLLFFKDTSFYFWSIEHQLLGFMVREDRLPNDSELYGIINEYYSNKSNVLFQDDVLKEYIQHVYDYFHKTYVDSKIPHHEHISDIIKHASKTWDLYSTTYILLRQLNKKPISRLGELPSFLKQAIHYNYLKRPSVQDHQNMYYKIIDSM